MAINGYLKKVMRKIIIILLASTSYFSCNNYQNEALVDEFITTEEVAVEELVVEEVVVEETPEKAPCEGSFDVTFEMAFKCNTDQYGVFHKESLTIMPVYRIVYQSEKSRIIVYKMLNNVETLYKVHENISCEYSKVEYLDDGNILQRANLYHCFFKSSEEMVLSISRSKDKDDFSSINHICGCRYFQGGNQLTYLSGNIYFPKYKDSGLD